jgi:hypothetical protein
MEEVISWSLMSDEASDIQMHKHLNMFVNMLLETGEVITRTLALDGTFLLMLLFLMIVICNDLIVL